MALLFGVGAKKCLMQVRKKEGVIVERRGFLFYYCIPFKKEK